MNKGSGGRETKTVLDWQQLKRHIVNEVREVETEETEERAERYCTCTQRRERERFSLIVAWGLVG